MQQLRIVQRPWIRRTDSVEDILLPARLIHWKIGCLLELSNRAGSRGTLADESNNLNIQLIDFFSPVGDVHPVSSWASGAISQAARCGIVCSSNDKRRFTL